MQFMQSSMLPCSCQLFQSLTGNSIRNEILLEGVLRKCFIFIILKILFQTNLWGNLFLLTYFSFIVLFQTQGDFPAKASFFSFFLAKSCFLKTVHFPPPLHGSHHDDSPKDTLEGFALIHILLKSPRSEKDLH